MGDIEEAIADERTSLLQNSSHNGHQTASIYSGDVSSRSSSSSDIEANEFDNLLVKSQSHNTALGIEPVSQETAMLRGERKYRRPSKVSIQERRRLSAGQNGLEDAVQDDEDDGAPFLAGLSTGRFWLIFSGMLVAYFISSFDGTIMVSSHPIITSYFNSSNSASWLSTAFLLTSTAFQALFGRLSDTIGRKIPYMFALVVFFGATFWCGAATSMLSLIWARALCGLGAGGMMTMASILTSDMVPIEVRGTYQSFINILYGVGAATGAATGGAIADKFGWRWEFYIQLPAIGMCLIIAYFTVPSDIGLRKGAKRKTIVEAMKVFDFRGSILLTTSITCLILGLNLGGNIYPWTHPIVLSSLAIFAVIFPLFLYVENYVTLPIMPLHIITSSPQANLIFSNFLGAIAINSILFNIPLFFQAVLQESATDSGLRLMVPSLAGSSFGVLTGFWITYSKRLKAPLLLGVGFALLGTVGLCFMTRGFPDWAYILFLMPTSMGQGFLFPGAFIAVLAVSERAEQAVVTSTLVLWRSIGTVLGVASSSLVVQNALLFYLKQYVHGPDKEDIILKVRSSVRAIQNLHEPYRGQVIDAYEASIRAAFLLSAVLAIATVAIIVPVRLPRLGQRK